MNFTSYAISSEWTLLLSRFRPHPPSLALCCQLLHVSKHFNNCWLLILMYTLTMTTKNRVLYAYTYFQPHHSSPALVIEQGWALLYTCGCVAHTTLSNNRCLFETPAPVRTEPSTSFFASSPSDQPHGLSRSLWHHSLFRSSPMAFAYRTHQLEFLPKQHHIPVIFQRVDL